MITSKQTGNTGENIAAKYLINKGYNIIESNYRTKRGEIDIIAEDNDILVFVEVKFRNTNLFGLGSYAVDRRKKQKIINTARSYIYENEISPEKAVRFDVIDIFENNIEHFEGAFRA